MIEKLRVLVIDGGCRERHVACGDWPARSWATDLQTATRPKWVRRQASDLQSGEGSRRGVARPFGGWFLSFVQRWPAAGARASTLACLLLARHCSLFDPRRKAWAKLAGRSSSRHEQGSTKRSAVTTFNSCRFGAGEAHAEHPRAAGLTA